MKADAPLRRLCLGIGQSTHTRHVLTDNDIARSHEVFSHAKRQEK